MFITYFFIIFIISYLLCLGKLFFIKKYLTNCTKCDIIGVAMKGGEIMPNQDIWSEMSYNKYKNAETLREKLKMEEKDVFEIDGEDDVNFEQCD